MLIRQRNLVEKSLLSQVETQLILRKLQTSILTALLSQLRSLNFRLLRLKVVDRHICGDPKSILLFAFCEFTDEEGARNALSLPGFVLAYYSLKVMPSKTAIAPVNPTFLPQSEDEREMCARTIYCTNIDRKVAQANVKVLFETFCGEVYCLLLLGDHSLSTRIAFVEFVMDQSVILALNFSGAILGSLPIRVSPSKTPVRPRAAPRSPMC